MFRHNGNPFAVPKVGIRSNYSKELFNLFQSFWFFFSKGSHTSQKSTPRLTFHPPISIWPRHEQRVVPCVPTSAIDHISTKRHSDIYDLWADIDPHKGRQINIFGFGKVRYLSVEGFRTFGQHAFSVSRSDINYVDRIICESDFQTIFFFFDWNGGWILQQPIEFSCNNISSCINV